MTVANLPLSSFDQPNVLSPQIKKRIALEALRNRKTITRILAQENNTSRKNVRQQRDRALEAVDKYFELDNVNAEDILFYLPVTKAWITQLVLVLMLLAHASYRNIAMIIKDLLDCDLSQGSINKIFSDAVDKAKVINSAEDLSSISVTANDELFHFSRPILTGIDTRSLYCYMLNSEDRRDEDTWAIRLMYAEDKGLNPQRAIGDDAKGLVAGHKKVFLKTSYDYDNFHITRGLMDLRKFFRNRLKAAINELNARKISANQSIDDTELAEQVILAKKEEEKARNISTTLDILISWLEHDILNKAGPTPNERRELYDFVVDEYKKLELIEPHRITEMRITLENKREMTLAFS